MKGILHPKNTLIIDNRSMEEGHFCRTRDKEPQAILYYYIPWKKLEVMCSNVNEKRKEKQKLPLYCSSGSVQVWDTQEMICCVVLNS